MKSSDLSLVHYLLYYFEVVTQHSGQDLSLYLPNFSACVRESYQILVGFAGESAREGRRGAGAGAQLQGLIPMEGMQGLGHKTPTLSLSLHLFPTFLPLCPLCSLPTYPIRYSKILPNKRFVNKITIPTHEELNNVTFGDIRHCEPHIFYYKQL